MGPEAIWVKDRDALFRETTMARVKDSVLLWVVCAIVGGTRTKKRQPAALRSLPSVVPWSQRLRPTSGVIVIFMRSF